MKKTCKDTQTHLWKVFLHHLSEECSIFTLINIIKLLKETGSPFIHQTNNINRNLNNNSFMTGSISETTVFPYKMTKKNPFGTTNRLQDLWFRKSTWGNFRRTKPKFLLTNKSTVTVSRTNGLCTFTATKSPFSFNRPLYTCPRDAAKKVHEKNICIKQQGQTFCGYVLGTSIYQCTTQGSCRLYLWNNKRTTKW